MRQSRLQSFIEQLVSLAIGVIIAFLAQLFIFPLLGIPVSINENIILVIFFTIISLARGYGVRRLFNWWHHRDDLK